MYKSKSGPHCKQISYSRRYVVVNLKTEISDNGKEENEKSKNDKVNTLRKTNATENIDRC